MLAHADRLVRAQARGGSRRPRRNGKDGDLEGFGKGESIQSQLFACFVSLASFQYGIWDYFVVVVMLLLFFVVLN